jgi:prophage maintenance system killer protein
METGEVIMYQSADGRTAIDVKLENETVWLSQAQMQHLFDQTKHNISLHIRNIFKEGELDKDSTVKEYLTVQKEGKRTVNRQIEHYSLDVIISVGYRVKSQRGTKFRIWANNILKDYLVKGYAVNEKRLREEKEQLDGLKKTVKLLGNVIRAQTLTSDEATGLLKVITDYTYALDVLDKYDHQLLEISDTTPKEIFEITYEQAIYAIQGLRNKFGGGMLFGNEKDESFQGSLAAIYQTFGRHSLYPSVEEKAANLLYFVIKNHSFSDGNKRIAAFCLFGF